MDLSFEVIHKDAYLNFDKTSYKNIYVESIKKSIPSDHLDTDADGDGCYDVVEAGFTDANNKSRRHRN